MESRTDIYGRTVLLTIVDTQEVYTTDGLSVAGPIGFGWDRALNVINAHAPAGAGDAQ
jgi:hypothetical protein